MTVLDLKPGETACISRINKNEDDLNYLMELGVLEGTPIRFVKTAPLGDPIEVDVRGFHLMLRRSRAGAIEIAK